jgi:uncharacterized protein
MFGLIILILFVLIPIVWIILKHNKTLKEALTTLLPKHQGLKKEAIGSVALFGALFVGFLLITMSFNVIQAGTGIELNDLDKVEEIVDNEIAQNFVAFMITLIIVVFIEEFFFRSFLVPRIGMILSTLIFTFFHYGYGSVAELIGVFFLGLILAYWFKKKKSIIQNYFGHLFYNLLAVLFYVLL